MLGTFELFCQIQAWSYYSNSWDFLIGPDWAKINVKTFYYGHTHFALSSALVKQVQLERLGIRRELYQLYFALICLCLGKKIKHCQIYISVLHSAAPVSSVLNLVLPCQNTKFQITDNYPLLHYFNTKYVLLKRMSL